VHAAVAAGFQSAEIIHLFNEHLDKHCLSERVKEELKKSPNVPAIHER
jgi:hypothetical protein